MLVRSGWGCRFAEGAAYVGRETGVPGVAEAGARWLAGHRPRAVGADTIAFERLAPGGGHSLLPAHNVLLVESGIYIVEAMDLDPLAAAGHAAFTFVLVPLNIFGATGSPVRPLAVLPRDRDRGPGARRLRRVDTLADLPPEVADSVGSRVLDILGIAVAAAPLDTSRAARRWAHEQGGRPVASAVGLPDRTSAPTAAFVNGVLAHSLDYDDTHLPSVLHPSAAVVPAALAAAERSGATGADVVRAVAIGLEVCVRLGMAGFDEEAGNSVFFEHGQHATSICGALGGAVAAACSTTGAGSRNPSGWSTPSASPRRWPAASSRPTAPAAPSSGCTAAGPPTPPCRPPTWSARASPGRRPCSRAGSGSSGRGSTRRADRGGDRGPRQPLGGPADLLQALPGQPLHPRCHRRGRRAARARA